MSAFMCSEMHLSALVNAADLHRYPLMRAAGKVTDQEHTVQRLASENARSIVARYGEAELREGGMAHGAEGMRWSGMKSEDLNRPVVATIKAANCYAYQACEHEAWETGEVKKWIDGLISHMIARLPGYDAAQWEVE